MSAAIAKTSKALGPGPNPPNRALGHPPGETARLQANPQDDPTAEEEDDVPIDPLHDLPPLEERFAVGPM